MSASRYIDGQPTRETLLRMAEHYDIEVERRELEYTMRGAAAASELRKLAAYARKRAETAPSATALRSEINVLAAAQP